MHVRATVIGGWVNSSEYSLLDTIWLHRRKITREQKLAHGVTRGINNEYTFVVTVVIHEIVVHPIVCVHVCACVLFKFVPFLRSKWPSSKHLN